MQGKALWYVGPGRAELREETVAAPAPGEVRLRALFGAISRGTERLVHAGRVPASEYDRMRAPGMGGAFPFPVKYGYATVGRVEALNAVWDGAPGPCDRIAIVGGGLVGLLVAYLCARLRGAQVTVVDIVSARAELADAIGAHFAAPSNAPTDCDLVFHASAAAAGLATALRLAGDEASVVELSWYGSGDVAVALGEAFHSRRLRLVSSQVGKVAPSHRARWSHGRRLTAALALLADPVLDALIAPALAFEELPAKLPSVFDSKSNVICQLIRYSDETR